MKVLLVGGSSGNHVLAADIGRGDTHELALLTRDPHRWSHTVACLEDHVGYPSMPFLSPQRQTSYTGKISLIFDWSETANALAWADAVIISAPVSAHPEILERLVPELPTDRRLILGTLYGQGGFDWTLRALLSRYPDRPAPAIFALKRFPYLCKKQDYGKSVYLMGRFPKIITAIEADENGRTRILGLLAELFGKKIEVLPGFFCCNFTLSNQVLHPAISWGLFSDYESGVTYPTAKRFYGDCNALAAQTLDDIADEIRTLARACEQLTGAVIHRHLGSDPPMVASLWLRDRIWKYCFRVPGLIRLRNELMALVFRRNQRLNKAPAPMLQNADGSFTPDFSSRFWWDDLPYGLCLVYGIAQILKLEMPVTAEMLLRQQRWLGKHYVTQVGNSIILDGDDVHETNAPQSFGVTDPEGLKRLLLTPLNADNQ